MTDSVKFNRVWAMPNPETFSVPPIGEFIHRHLVKSTISVDPFSRNRRDCTWTNDIDPETKSQFHLDAVDFLEMLASKGLKADLFIFDPPYSPRQISECYSRIGIKCDRESTQNASLYARVRKAAIPILSEKAAVLSFGWNSTGMGKKSGFALEEILMVCHGSAHNDTICIAERRLPSTPVLL